MSRHQAAATRIKIEFKGPNEGMTSFKTSYCLPDTVDPPAGSLLLAKAPQGIL
jgi:hypothetical protein